MQLAAYKPDEVRLVDEITRRAIEHGIVEVLEEFFQKPQRAPASYYTQTPARSTLWAAGGHEPLHRLTGRLMITPYKWERLLERAEAEDWKGLEVALRRPVMGQPVLKYRNNPSPRTLVAMALAMCPVLQSRIDVHTSEVVVTHNKGEWVVSLEPDGYRGRNGVLHPTPHGDIEWELMTKPLEPIIIPHIAASLRGLLMVEDPYLEFLLTWFCAYKTNSTQGRCDQYRGKVRLQIRRPTALDTGYLVLEPQPLNVEGWWDTKTMGKSTSVQELQIRTIDMGAREIIPVNVLELFNHHVVFGRTSPEAFQEVIGKHRRVIAKGEPGVWPVSVGTIRRWYFKFYDY